MTTRPYTTADLRHEAARQLAAAADPGFTGVGERMRGARIASTVVDPDAPVTSRDGGHTWDMLAREDWEAAQRAVAVLLDEAADVSDWAIALGADGLEPSGHHFDVGGDGKPVRVHLAFAEDMPEKARAGVAVMLAQLAAEAF